MTTMNNDGGGGLSSRVVSVIGYHIVLASISVSPCSMMPFIYPGIIVEVKSRCCYFLFDDGRHIVSCEGELNVFPWPNARDLKNSPPSIFTKNTRPAHFFHPSTAKNLQGELRITINAGHPYDDLIDFTTCTHTFNSAIGH